MNRTAFFFSVIVLMGGCAHTPKSPQVELPPPWRHVSDGVAGLVEDRAERSAFERFREFTVSPQRLQSFAAVERISGGHGRKYAAAERDQQRQWFQASATVWHYTFESEFSGILFCDASGRVQHAILLG